MVDTNDDGIELPLIGVRSTDLAPRVLVVGDPARAATAADRLDGVRRVGSNREYVSYTGSYADIPVSVVSHGIGSAGAGIAFEALCRGGAERIIRCGTAGGLQPDVSDGSVVIATGAVRCDGLSPRLIPIEYPAISDLDVVVDLITATSSIASTVRSGVVVTSDVFFPHPLLGSDLERWQQAGCIAVEMELSALLIVAALHGIAAGGILAIDGNPLRDNDAAMDNYQPDRAVVRQAVEAALTATLDALVA